MAVGGDITEVRWSHPVLGSGVVYPKSGEDATLELGGFRSNDDANSIDGSGTRIDQMNRVCPFFECVVANDMNVNQDAEKISALASHPVPADWTISHISGTTYRLTGGKPVGDIQPNANAATFTLKVAGSGQMKQVR